MPSSALQNELQERIGSIKTVLDNQKTSFNGLATKLEGANTQIIASTASVEASTKRLEPSVSSLNASVETLVSESHDRPVVRRLLDGRLPDAIRLRTRGMPASPDHLPRLQRQAGAAQQRIAAFRQAELDEWLDLEWLDAALGRVGAHGANDVADANMVQLTTIFAEFLLWWRTRF